MLDIRKDLDYSIDVHNINLKSINQLAVWSWLLNQHVDIGAKIYNTFRVDNNPTCTVNYYGDNIVLVDFGKPFHGWTIYKAVHHVYISSFPTKDDVARNFRLILHYILSKPDNILTGQDIYNHTSPYNKFKINLLVKNKNWSNDSLREWRDYGITHQNLVDDRVYPVDTYWMNSRSKPDELTFFKPKLMYDIPVGKMKKLYSMNPKVFITNQSSSLNGKYRTDVGYVCKFYKDYRVVANLGLSAYYTNGENALIPEAAVRRLANDHKIIYVVRDNDETGHYTAKKVCDHANGLIGKTMFFPMFMIDAKDPSDVVKLHDYETLNKNLKQ